MLGGSAPISVHAIGVMHARRRPSVPARAAGEAAAGTSARRHTMSTTDPARARPAVPQWVGVTIAAPNAIAQVFFIPAYPFMSLALFTLDILVIYGLVAYAARTRDA
jgi:hypothetical protein